MIFQLDFHIMEMYIHAQVCGYNNSKFIKITKMCLFAKKSDKIIILLDFFYLLIQEFEGFLALYKTIAKLPF